MNSKTKDLYGTRIVLFTRFPVPGKTKTRLIPSLGPTGAADFQRKMTEFAVQQVARTGISSQIQFAGGTVAQMKGWLGEGPEYAPQEEGDLGRRMARAFADAFAKGANKVLVIGCDCPDNRTDNILKAARALNRSPCVLGPAADGGYYLIGLTEPCPGLFSNVDWGSDSVLRQTTAKLDEYELLPVLRDVDEPKDIPLSISVVIPALNESDRIESVVKQVLEGFNTEAIVVDGGSTDRTRETAARAGAKVIRSSPGRALQMNFGARRAAGDILLFLHADSVLPPAWDVHVRYVMKQPRTTLGYFHFAISGSFMGKRWVEWGANVRSRFFNRPYGDQGLFLRRNEFMNLGKFPEVPILEDVFFVKAAKKRGRVCCTNVALATSGRRWVKYGAVKTTFINQAVLLAAWLGADLEYLNRAYRKGINPLYFLNSRKKGTTLP